MVAIEHSVIGIATALLLAAASAAGAQVDRAGIELGVQVPAASSSEFDQVDVGLGGRLAWHPAAWLGVEGELDVYPRSFPAQAAFSRGRVEGLFGATIGSELGRVRPFGKVRPGFLMFRASSEPLACIAVFPPPLSCTLANGRTLFALDLGGGIEVAATPRTFLRIDAGDLLVRYPGPVRDRTSAPRESFFGHDFRFSAGAGLRF